MSNSATQDLPHVWAEGPQGATPPQPVAQPMAERPISPRDAHQILALFENHFKVKPRVSFSPRVTSRQTACFSRPLLMLLPSGGPLLTERAVLHEYAHILDLEGHRLRPHSPTFKAHLKALENLWWG
jgi:hypothetical protein